jgi:hypothetical protein
MADHVDWVHVLLDALELLAQQPPQHDDAGIGMPEIFERMARDRTLPLPALRDRGACAAVPRSCALATSPAGVGDRVGPRLPAELRLAILDRPGDNADAAHSSLWTGTAHDNSLPPTRGQWLREINPQLSLSLSSAAMREHSMDPAFGSWLGRRYRPAVVASRLANCRRVEDYYGDLDRAYSTARMPIVLEALRYSSEDDRHKRPNPSRVPISGNLREGLATLRHAVTLYIQFRESAQYAQSAGRIPSPIRSPARARAGATPPLVGDEVLRKAASELEIDLVRLVAKVAIWADPNVVRARREIHPHAAFFSDYRRGKKGEKRGDVIGGERIDDNTKANLAIKIIVFGSPKRCRQFHVCHVWPKTCYDVRYHTSLPNLVLALRARQPFRSS